VCGVIYSNTLAYAYAYAYAYIHTYEQIAAEQAAALSRQHMSALTPRLRAWLGTLAQPDQQTGQIALALAEESYTSVEIIVEEDVERLLALPKMEAVKPGAKIAIKKKLSELKVHICWMFAAHILNVAGEL
jgi:hypothetical protein